MIHSKTSVVSIMLVILFYEASARPGYQTVSSDNETNLCQLNEEIDTLCQRCAKSTKSSLVYPMCCQNTEEVMDWCKKYISFGIQ